MAIHRLPSDTAVKKLIENEPRTKHSDGGGLILQVTDAGQASWMFRYFDKAAGKELWPSIGPAATYTLDEAREKARQCRIELKEGRSPKAFLSSGRTAPGGKTFAEAMTEYLAAKSPHWAASNRARELRRYAYLFGQIPDFTALRLPAIDQAAKNKALATWDAQPKARRDVGFYIEAIIRYAESGKLRVVKVADEQEHHEAMPWRDVPDFYKRIARLNTDDARALRFTILTGARTDEVIGAEYKGEITKAPATWREIEDIASAERC